MDDIKIFFYFTLKENNFFCNKKNKMSVLYTDNSTER